MKRKRLFYFFILLQQKGFKRKKKKKKEKSILKWQQQLRVQATRSKRVEQAGKTMSKFIEIEAREYMAYEHRHKKCTYPSRQQNIQGKLLKIATAEIILALQRWP